MADDRAPADPADPATPLAPGQQADPTWIAPSTRRLLWRALALWLALAALLAGLQLLTTGALPQPLTLARRMGQLLQESWLFLVLPPLVIGPIGVLGTRLWATRLVSGGRAREPVGGRSTPPQGVVRRAWVFEIACNLGLFGFMGTGLVWAGVGVVYALDGTDPWDHMPGVTPPYLESFVERHPQLRVEKINGVYEVQLTHREMGGWLRLNGRVLAASDLRFERCTSAWSAADFAGMPLHPKAECRRVVTIQRPGAEARVVVRFNTPTELRFADLRRFYEDAAKAAGMNGSFTGGPSQFDFRAEGGGRQWNLHVPDARSPGPSLILERGGRRPPVSDMDREEPVEPEEGATGAKPEAADPAAASTPRR